MLRIKFDIEVFMNITRMIGFLALVLSVFKVIPITQTLSVHVASEIERSDGNSGIKPFDKQKEK